MANPQPLSLRFGREWLDRSLVGRWPGGIWRTCWPRGRTSYLPIDERNLDFLNAGPIVARPIEQSSVPGHRDADHRPARAQPRRESLVHYSLGRFQSVVFWKERTIELPALPPDRPGTNLTTVGDSDHEATSLEGPRGRRCHSQRTDEAALTSTFAAGVPSRVPIQPRRIQHVPNRSTPGLVPGEAGSLGGLRQTNRDQHRQDESALHVINLSTPSLNVRSGTAPGTRTEFLPISRGTIATLTRTFSCFV